MTARGRVSIMMKNLMILLALAACGPKKTNNVSNTTEGSGSATAATDTRTAIEKRRDAACETLGPKVTQCALDDAKKALAAGQVKQKDFDESTKPAILKKNTEEFIAKCQHPKTEYSSRQIRVLEVCQEQESQCEPLLACLDNLNKP